MVFFAVKNFCRIFITGEEFSSYPEV